MTINTETTTATERRIVNKIIDRALANGWTISVNDDSQASGKWVVKRTRSKSIVEAALATTEGDVLLFRDPTTGERVGWVSLIWGNGEEVVFDCSANGEMEELVDLACA